MGFGGVYVSRHTETICTWVQADLSTLWQTPLEATAAQGLVQLRHTAHSLYFCNRDAGASTLVHARAERPQGDAQAQQCQTASVNLRVSHGECHVVSVKLRVSRGECQTNADRHADT